jgi:tetratricopeptide (TPR) repeat protein
MRPAHRARLIAGLLCGAQLVVLPALAQEQVGPEISEAARAAYEARRARHTRQLLMDARAFLRQDRAASAERALLRGLAVAPDDARLHHLLADVLALQQRSEESLHHRRRADELDPPPPPLPAGALAAKSKGILVALVPPGASTEPPERVAGDWPDGIAAQTLAERLRLRLPRAGVAFASPQTIAEARRLLSERSPRSAISLRVDRSFCADTLKDGFFAVAWLRVAAELPGEVSEGPDERREVVVNPRAPGDCRAEALARGLERVFRHRIVRRALAAPRARRARWSNTAIRALFPGLGERIKAELDRGRALLATGRIADAAERFRAAAEIDPEDPIVRAYLDEAEATLAMAQELSLRRDPENIREEDRGVLDPRFSPQQRAAAEGRLEEERRRRADLLAAQQVMREEVRVPGSDTLAVLRRGTIRDPEAFGPATARERAGGEVEALVAFAPDGSEIVRYYRAADGGPVVLREEDTNGDGQPDRWIAYYAGIRCDIWEDEHGAGTPSLRFVFALGGNPLQQIELDTNHDGRIERIIHYGDGTLRAESRDSDGDGVLDRFDRFDDAGHVETRFEDLDGDGRIDVRSSYRDGRLIERSFDELDFAPEGP